MADEDDVRRRRREREEEEEDERAKPGSAPASKTANKLGFSKPEAVPVEKFDEMIQRADVMIEQLNNLYKMFVVGVEKLPPNEKRKALDQLMYGLQIMSKPTPSANFKFSSIQSRYEANKERWEKMLKDLESGKIKRTAGNKH
jgi:hypothetical protein